MKNNVTSLIYDYKNADSLYNDICNALDIIEKVECETHSDILIWRYERDYTRRWFRFFKRAFYGTLDEYIQINHLSDKQIRNRSIAYNRMAKIHDLVSDSIQYRLNFVLSLSDHTFIYSCLTHDELSSTFIHNAALT